MKGAGVSLSSQAGCMSPGKLGACTRVCARVCVCVCVQRKPARTYNSKKCLQTLSAHLHKICIHACVRVFTNVLLMGNMSRINIQSTLIYILHLPKGEVEMTCWSKEVRSCSASASSACKAASMLKSIATCQLIL